MIKLRAHEKEHSYLDDSSLITRLSFIGYKATAGRYIKEIKDEEGNTILKSISLYKFRLHAHHLLKRYRDLNNKKESATENAIAFLKLYGVTNTATSHYNSCGNIFIKVKDLDKDVFWIFKVPLIGDRIIVVLNPNSPGQNTFIGALDV